MEKIKLTADTPAYLKIWEIEKELLDFTSILDEKYESLDFAFWFCFRALYDSTINSGWKSKVTFYKKYNALSFDIIMPEKDFKNMDVFQQRKIMGNYFFPFFQDSIIKYRKKISCLLPIATDLIEDMKQFLLEKEWL